VSPSTPDRGRRQVPWQGAFDGEAYQRRFEELAARGADVHGEAAFVLALSPTAVLDAGCGTGRVAIELARHGVEVVGVDVDPSMLAEARRRAPGFDWRQADLVGLDLGRTFDVVLLAGNVPLFTPPGTEAALIASCARHVAPAGHLVAGFQLGRNHSVETHDAACAGAGLVPEARYATWERDPFDPTGGYALLVHRRP
jgi:SAM-dependent methyltransferase